MQLPIHKRHFFLAGLITVGTYLVVLAMTYMIPLLLPTQKASADASTYSASIIIASSTAWTNYETLNLNMWHNPEPLYASVSRSTASAGFPTVVDYPVGVTFYLDNVQIGNEITASTTLPGWVAKYYTTSLDTTSYNVGSAHVLKLVARFSGGDTSTVEWGSDPSRPLIIRSKASIPTISSVTAAFVDQTSAQYIWSTDVRSNTGIDWGLDTNYGFHATGTGNDGTFHSILISNLTPNTTYHFRPVSKSVVSPFSGYGPDGTFTTLAPSDTTAPTLTLVNPVAASTTATTTPTITFSTTEAGTITYGGNCSSSVTSVSAGSNTIRLNTLARARHSNCTIRITDSSSNASTVLSIPQLIITLRSDANLSGNVNLGDYNRLVSNYGRATCLQSEGDFNNSCLVNLADYNILVGEYGRSV